MKPLKKTLSVILAATIALGSLAGCGSRVELTSVPVTVEGSIFSGAKDAAVKTDIAYAPELLIKADNTKYNRDIAAFAGLLSADVYFRDKDLERGTQNRVLIDGKDAAEYGHTTLLEELGFDDVEYVETFKAGSYDTDTNDSATLLMAHANYKDKYDTYVFVLRGCFSIQEWLSAYDPGADGTAYEALTGEHPEWQDKAQFKGYSVAAARAKHFMDDFMERTGDPARKNVVLVTGHSRGGSLANVIGAAMENDPAVKSFTYTFNAAGVDMNAVPGAQKTVYNVFEARDMFIDILPFGEEEAHRYGTDVTLSGDEAGIAQQYQELTGREMPECLTAEEVEEFHTLFGERFPNRAALFEERTITETFEDEETAQARHDACAELIGAEAGLGLEAVCSVSDVEKTEEGYQITLTYCDEAWMECFAKTLAYGTAAYEGSMNLFAGDAEGCKVADFLGNHLAQISAGHQLLRSYLIAKTEK